MKKHLASLLILLVISGTFLGLPTPSWWDDVVREGTKIINTSLQTIKMVYQILVIVQNLVQTYQRLQNQSNLTV